MGGSIPVRRNGDRPTVAGCVGQAQSQGYQPPPFNPAWVPRSYDAPPWPNQAHCRRPRKRVMGRLHKPIMDRRRAIVDDGSPTGQTAIISIASMLAMSFPFDFCSIPT